MGFFLIYSRSKQNLSVFRESFFSKVFVDATPYALINKKNIHPNFLV